MNNERQSNSIYILCLISMFEKFSFHGVRFTLVLYLSQFIKTTDSFAYTIYGTLMVLTYFIPTCINYLTKYISNRRNITLYAAVMLGMGSLCLIPESKLLFYLGLSLVVLGGGIFRYAIPLYLGEIYTKSNFSNHSGFTILYVCINIGSFLASLCCGYVGEFISWKISFLITSLSAFLSLIFIRKIPCSHEIKQKKNTEYKKIIVFVFFLISLINVTFYNYYILNLIVSIGVLSIIISFFKWLIDQDIQTHKLQKLLGLMLLQMIFFAFYEQGPSSFVIFINNFVSHNIGVFHLPITFFQSVDPVINLLIGTILSYVWYAWKKSEDLEFTKYGIGFFMVFLSFLLISSLIHFFTGNNQEIPAFYMILVFVLLVVGELFIVPIGISYAATMSNKMKGSVMGVWSMSIGVGQWLATNISRRLGVSSLSEDTLIGSFQDIYIACSLISFLIFIIIFGTLMIKKLSPLMKKSY